MLCITPVLDIPIVTQDGGPPLLAGPQEVVRQAQSYSLATRRPFAIPLADKWRGDLASCCHLPKSPLTPCIPKISVISKDGPPPTSHLRVLAIIFCTRHRRNFLPLIESLLSSSRICFFVFSNLIRKKKKTHF